MRILGIDPGYGIVGYGIIDAQNQNCKLVDFGVITTPKELDLNERIFIIGEEIKKIISSYSPTEIAIEELFFYKNVKTAIKVAQARGAIIYACRELNIPIGEYTPLQVKQGLTGYGRAEKNQVQQMVKLILNMQSIPKPDDAADALAIAITHANTKNFAKFS